MSPAAGLPAARGFFSGRPAASARRATERTCGPWRPAPQGAGSTIRPRRRDFRREGRVGKAFASPRPPAPDREPSLDPLLAVLGPPRRLRGGFDFVARTSGWSNGFGRSEPSNPFSQDASGKTGVRPGPGGDPSREEGRRDARYPDAGSKGSEGEDGEDSAEADGRPRNLRENSETQQLLPRGMILHGQEQPAPTEGSSADFQIPGVEFPAGPHGRARGLEVRQQRFQGVLRRFPLLSPVNHAHGPKPRSGLRASPPPGSQAAPHPADQSGQRLGQVQDQDDRPESESPSAPRPETHEMGSGDRDRRLGDRKGDGQEQGGSQEQG